MVLFDLDSSKIFFKEVRDYFEEVITSYTSGFYRSSIVLLYSTAICDAMKKLKEMKEVFNDEKAKNLLSDVETLRLQGKNYTEWEDNLIEKIKIQKIYDFDDIMNLSHLKEKRNLAAHPTLNNEYDLYKPTQEETLFFIKSMYKIFIKPPFFCDDIIRKMDEDVTSRQNYFIGDYFKLKGYLERTYLSYMNEHMVAKAIKAYWKFVFRSSINSDCKTYWELNRQVLGIIYDYNNSYTTTYFNDTSNHAYLNQIDDDPETLIKMTYFISRHTEIYEVLNDENKEKLDTFLNKVDSFSYKLIAWFPDITPDNYLSSIELPTQDWVERIILKNNIIRYLHSQTETRVSKDVLRKLYIKLYKNVNFYDESEDRFYSCIEPFLNDFTVDEFIEIITSINENHQHYENWYQRGHNDKIYTAAKGKLPTSFNLSNYPHFHITES